MCVGSHHPGGPLLSQRPGHLPTEVGVPYVLCEGLSPCRSQNHLIVTAAPLSYCTGTEPTHGGSSSHPAGSSSRAQGAPTHLSTLACLPSILVPGEFLSGRADTSAEQAAGPACWQKGSRALSQRGRPGSASLGLQHTPSSQVCGRRVGSPAPQARCVRGGALQMQDRTRLNVNFR